MNLSGKDVPQKIVLHDKSITRFSDNKYKRINYIRLQDIGGY